MLSPLVRGVDLIDGHAVSDTLTDADVVTLCQLNLVSLDWCVWRVPISCSTHATDACSSPCLFSRPPTPTHCCRFRVYENNSHSFEGPGRALIEHAIVMVIAVLHILIFPNPAPPKEDDKKKKK